MRAPPPPEYTRGDPHRRPGSAVTAAAPPSGSTVTGDGYRRFPDGLPDDLLDRDDVAILRALGRPTLIRVPGTGEAAPRAVATLLHGNESTGYQAVLRILRRRRTYPFDLYVVVGNVRAALEQGLFGHRYLDGQEDFNRIWGRGDAPAAPHDAPAAPHGTPAAPHGGEPRADGRDPARQDTAPAQAGASSGPHEAAPGLRRAAAGMLDELRSAGLESAVDVHNNSGDNPFYAIVTRLHPATLNLATLFTTTLLHWDLRAHTFMEALEPDCAAIAVECGQPGRPESLAFAVDGLRRYLGDPPLASDRVTRDYDLYGNLRRVVVRDGIRFAFGGALSDEVDLVVAPDADATNFRPVPSGHVIGLVRAGVTPLRALDATGADVTDQHFTVADGTVRTTRRVTPVMMTRTVEAARKDCLLYLADEQPPEPVS